MEIEVEIAVVIAAVVVLLVPWRATSGRGHDCLFLFVGTKPVAIDLLVEQWSWSFGPQLQGFDGSRLRGTCAPCRLDSLRQ